MIPRRSVDASAVARALGLEPDRVRLAEPIPVAGARASLTLAFRANAAPPRRPARIAVFPYADPAWDEAVRAWLAVEAACFRAWWGWVADGLGRDAHGVWRVAPLTEPLQEAIRVTDVADDAGALPALVRPWLDWPEVGAAALSDDRLRAQWAQLREVLGAVIAPAAGVPLDLPDDPLLRADLRRRLLTDGRTLAPTSFRAFLRPFQHLDEARPRVAG